MDASTPTPSVAPLVQPGPPPAAVEPSVPNASGAGQAGPDRSPVFKWALMALLAISLASAWLAIQSQRRVQTLEQELVKRQQESQTQALEARLMARQAQDAARDAQAKTMLLDTRLSEVALQRSQVEDLIKTLSLSRDENLLYDIEAGLRLASQQAALTGGAEPLIASLQAADARLERAHQPRLDNVRRAVARDLDRIRATRVADLNTLAIRLDEAIRLVDDAPLINQGPADASNVAPAPTNRHSGAAGRPASAASSGVGASAADAASDDWRASVLNWSRGAAQSMWHETRALIRLTKIDQPEAMLLAPDQAYFLRENIKLKLLNARLALMSRQTALATVDLDTVSSRLPRYFDVHSRKTQLLQSMVAEVTAQCQQTTVPRPDDTLAALAALSGGH